MDENNFQIMLQAVLDKIKSIANIKENIKAIEPKLPKIKLRGTLNKTEVKKELNTKLKTINPKVKIDADTTQAEKKIRKINQQKSNPTVTPTVDNSQVVSGLKQAQKETKTLWERFTNGIFGINLIRMGIQEVTRAIRQAISNIKELDAIKTNIQMVSGTSDSGANATMSGYNSMAKDLSSTTKEVAEAANEFLRMGESVASTNELIKSSQVLSKVGMIESAESASYLISSLKGYKIAAENSMDVVSKLTSVDLEAAVSAGGLAEALSKCSNIADNSGVAMDRLIGYTATVGETTQKSMSEVGNSFQALLSRMNNIKIGKFIDDETGESLSDTEAVLNKLGIQLRDTENTYRSFDAVLDDIGSRWKEFTKVEQNAISVAIAGTRQRENFEALMNNYGNALKYAETAANSAGNALERYGVYQDSIQAKTNELTAAIESLSTNVISEDLYSGIIEATTGVVEFIDKTNLLKGTLAGLVAMGISKTIASIGAGFITAAKSTAQLTAAMALFDNGRSKQNLLAIGTACKGLSDQQLKLVLSTKGLTDAQRKSILIGMGVAESEQQQTLTTLGFAAAEDKATISTFSLKGALNSLKTVIATNSIGVIVTAVSAATIAFSAYKQHMEEIRQATEEAANAYSEATDSIDDYVSKYQELREALIAAKGNEEETYNVKKQLLDLQTELNNKFGEEYGTLNLVTDAYKDQTEAIKAYNKEAANTYLNENRKGIEIATDKMTEDLHYSLSYTGVSAFTDEGAALKEIAEKYEDQGITLLDELGDGSYAQFSVHLKADAQSAYETINAFENDLRDKANELGDEHMFDDVLEISSSELNNAKEIIDNYGNEFKKALNAEIVIDDDKAKTYAEALHAVEAYNDAVLKSEDPYNDANVTKAKENLDTIKATIQGNEEEWGKYSYLMDDVFGQADTRLLEFNEALKTDNGLKELAGDLEGLSNLDLQSFDENVGENNSFDKLKEAAKEYKVDVEELIDALIRLGYVQGEIQGSSSDDSFSTTLSISKTIEQLNTQIKPAFDVLKSVWHDIFADDEFALNSIDIISTCDSIKAKLDEMSKLGLDVDYSSYEHFVDILNSSDSTVDDVKEGFNQLATSITQAGISGAEDFETMKAALEDLGIINEELVAFDALISNTEALKEAGLDLASATDEQIAAFANEIVSTENVSQAIAMLTFQKELCGLQDMDTAGEVANLLTLAENAGYTGEVIEQLTELKQIYQQVASGTLTPGQLDAKLARAAELETAIKESASNIKYEPKVDFSGATKSASKAGKKHADEYLKAFQEEYSNLKDMLNRGEISEAQYLNRLRALYNKYFRDRKKYLDEFKEYESEYLSGMLDLHNKALSGISTLLNRKINAANDAKDASISTLEEEKEAAEEAYQAQIDAIEKEKEAIDDLIKEKNKKIASLNEEIDAIERAAESRKKNIQLEKDQYNLEKMLNNRSSLVYKDGQFIWDTDTSGIRDAREKVTEAKEALQIDSLKNEISLIQKEIGLLEEKKDALSEEQKNIQKLMDESNKYYDNLIKQQEQYWDSLIKGMEQQKSRWEELAEVKEIAEAFSYIQQVFGDLGYTVEDVLNGSDAAFEDFKSRYISLISDVNSNSDFTDGLVYATGVAEENLGSFLNKTKETADGISDLSTKGSELNTVAEGMGDLADSATTANTNTGELATSMGELNTNTEGLSDNLTSINDALTGLPEAENINAISDAFTNMGEAIQAVADVLGIGEEGAVGGLVGALQSLSELSLGESGDNGQGGGTGIVSQFQALKTAVDDVTNAISGGGSSGSSGGGDASNSSSQSMSSGADGENASGLVGAIESFKSATDEALGSGGEEGEGSGGTGAIPQFQELKTAVDNVIAAIGIDESENSEGSENTLIGALRAQYETAFETLPETKALFEELLESIMSCVGALNSMVSLIGSMSEIGGLGSPGISVTPHAKGTVGNAYVKGTGKYKGLANREKNALVSEYGQPEMTVLPNGKTILTDEPTMMDLPKDTVIFNEEQTKKIIDNKVDVSGNAHADGTDDGIWTTLADGTKVRPLQPGDKMYDLQQKFESYFKSIDGNLEKLVPNSYYEQNREWNKLADQISYANSVVNNRNVQQSVNNVFNITMPNVTDSTRAEELMSDLQSISRKKYQIDW